MEPGIPDIKKNYSSFSNEKLIKIALNDAYLLRPEALAVLEEVMNERRISPDVFRGIEAQVGEIDGIIVEEYAELLRMLACPICNSTNEKLNATILYKTKSFILTYYEKDLIIACPDCLDELNRDAMFKSGLFGWWGFPWGIIRTIQALIGNKKSMKHNRLPMANVLLMNFAYQRIGIIEANRNKPEELQLLIQQIT